MLPQGSLVLCGSTLYGTTSYGGSGGYRAVFGVNTVAPSLPTPIGGLLISGHTLYGTTSSGGSNDNGTIFALSLGPIPLSVQNIDANVVVTWGNPAFSLQSAPSINGPYTTIPGATSPYTNAVTAAQQFFRLQISE